MSGMGQLGAYAGLLTSESPVAQGQRTMAALDHMSGYVDQKRKEGMQLDEIEADQYDQIRKEASTLLERDREKVNKKAIAIQVDIKNKVKEYGSKQKFYENGGVSILKKAKTDLLYSDETNLMRDNQKNLERILQVQAAGKGQYISKKNMKMLTDYQNGSSDRIEFDGLKTEVDIPNEYFQFGKEIPTEEIMRTGDNYLRLWSNYLLENPEMKGLTGQDQYNAIYQYTKENHNGLGKDKTELEFQKSKRLLELQQKEARKAATPEEDDTPKNYFAQVSDVVSNAPGNHPMTADQIVADPTTGKEKNYWNNIREKDAKVGALFGNTQTSAYNNFHKKTNYKSNDIVDKVLHETGLELLGKIAPNKYFKPASAIVIPEGINQELAKGIFDEAYDPKTKQATIQITDDGDYYSTTGEVLDKNKLDYDAEDEAEPMVVGKSFLAFVDGDGNMLTNQVDDKGKIDNDANRERVRLYGKGKARTAMFTTLTKQSDGEVYYKKSEIDNLPQLSSLQAISGPGGKIGDVAKERKADQKEFDKFNAQVKENKKQIQNGFEKASATGAAFGNPAFYAESQMFTTETGNRNKLIKAYYAAYSDLNKKTPTPGNFNPDYLRQSGLVEQRLFTKTARLHPEISQLALDRKNISDEAFIDQFTKIVSGDSTEDLQDNTSFANLWKAYYKNL